MSQTPRNINIDNRERKWKKKFKKEAGRAMTSHSLQMSSSHDSLQWNMCPVMWAFTPTGVLKQKKKMQPYTLFQISKLERNMFFLTFTQKWATFRLKNEFCWL